MTDREVMQQALEALEHHSAIKHPQQIHYRDTAIAALKAALEQQQAEPPPEWPLIKNILAVFGLDAISFVAKWQAAQQAEPVAWDKPSASFNEWWDSYRHDPANPFAEGSAACWAWAGWMAAQRQWVGLTDDAIWQIATDCTIGGDLHADKFVRAIEAKLKERNT